MNQTESIKAYLEEKASKHELAYTDISKYTKFIQEYLDWAGENVSCSTCKFCDLDGPIEPCKSCVNSYGFPNWQKS